MRKSKNSVEVMTPGVGKGKGTATNVPEKCLIDQVRIRPLLYDKNVKDYRKPGVSDSAWDEVAKALGTTVTNCKKRWKSLRDTFIKYYRMDVTYNVFDSKRKQKAWSFYDDMLFLKGHVDMFRLEDNSSIKEVTPSPGYLKDRFIEPESNERIVLVEETGSKDVYEIQQDYDNQNYRSTEELEEGYEEQVEDTTEEGVYEFVEHEENLETSALNKIQDEHFVMFDNELDGDEVLEEVATVAKSNKLFTDSQKQSQESLSSEDPPRNITDPDERYLMSCLPAFKRFSTQQKAYVRMGIERLFYEVEFESSSQPRNKRPKNI